MSLRRVEPARHRSITAIVIGALLISAATLGAAELRGSRASMLRQRASADRHAFTTLRRTADVRRFVRAGRLVPVRKGANLDLAGVSYPYARPMVRTFLDRLSAEHRRACGRKLVVTSLTRPLSRQPRNASKLSVHTTGMAVDLRQSSSPTCRAWLERTLLDLERSGAIEATREHRPPHYHVAVFPPRNRPAPADDEEADDAAPIAPVTSPGVIPVNAAN